MSPQENCLFTLRCWGEDGHWRWSLKRVGDETRIGFPDLDSLYLYLSRLTESGESEPREGPEPSQGPDMNPGDPDE